MFLYATQKLRAVVFCGRVVQKRMEFSKYWPIDYEGQDIWPYRVELEPVHPELEELRRLLQGLPSTGFEEVLKQIALDRSVLEREFGLHVTQLSYQRIPDNVGSELEKRFRERVQQVLTRHRDRSGTGFRIFNPVMLQTPQILPSEDRYVLYLELLGHVLRNLVLPRAMGQGVGAKFSRDEVLKVAVTYLRSRNVEFPQYYTTNQLRPRFTNDLRRLDILRTSDFTSNWVGEEAHPGKTTLFLVTRQVQDLDLHVLGSVAVAVAIIVGETPCCQALRHVLCDEHSKVEELAKQYGVKVEVQELKKLVDVVREHLSSTPSIARRVLLRYGVPRRLLLRLTRY